MATFIATPQKIANAEIMEVVQARSPEFNWVFFVVIAAFHLGAVAALFTTFHWSSVVVFLVMWLFGQNVGIAISYHRQLTHRSFSTPKWVEYAMAVCGTMALQGSPIYWVAVHRMHHQYTDKPGDPHSPRDGKWWSHMGWILHGSLHSETTTLSRYAPDLQHDRFVGDVHLPGGEQRPVLALVQVDAHKLHDIHLLISTISRPEHLTLFENAVQTAPGEPS